MAATKAPPNLDIEALRAALDAISNQLCYAVDGRFDFSIRVETHDESVQKLQMLINYVLDSARRALDQLKTSEARFAERVRNHPDGIATLDPLGRVLSLNPAAELLLGVTERAAINRSVGALGLLCLAQAHRDALADAEAPDAGANRTRVVPITGSDGQNRMVEIMAARVSGCSGWHVQIVARDVTRRESDAARLRLLTVALESAAEAIVITNAAGTIEWVNESFTRLTGYSREEAVGGNPRLLRSGRQDEAFYREMWGQISGGSVWSGRLRNRRKNGEHYTERMTITPVRSQGGQITHFIAIKQDITEEIARESQRAHTQKLESIGQLAAGIAHEINTPTQYVSDNTRFLKDSVGDLLKLVERFSEMLRPGAERLDWSTRAATLQEALAEAEIDFLREEIPKAIEQSLEGLERVTRIVRAMKDFSHPTRDELMPADLNKAIDSTVTVARNEWKYVADLSLDLDSRLPLVPVSLGDFNQAILNLVVNAAHAIEDVPGRGTSKGRIVISTRRVDGHVEIRVADSGTGIAPEHRDKVFDHFFTTKRVGRGTGQGLAVARAVIVDKHKGALTFETEPGVGTTFIIRLPLPAAASPENQHAGPEPQQSSVPDAAPDSVR